MQANSDDHSHLESSARLILDKLRAEGFVAYYAGGCVRDRLLGRLAKDIDIATSATPQQVKRLFPKAQMVGAHFGVALVQVGKLPFEIATFRTDGSYSDGRRPESVNFSSPEEDAQRRDFTINGLFYDPMEEKVVDYVSGQEDLAARQIRAIGDAQQRFSEDYLRLLRAIRFAVTLDFDIEEQTWAAIQANAAGLRMISQERIEAEFSRMMKLPQRQRAFDLLVASGLMKEFLPEILALQGCEQPPQWHPEGDVFVHTRMMLGKLPPDASLSLVLAVLFHDIAKPATQTVDETGRIRFNGHDAEGAIMAEGILRRFRYSNDVVEAVVEMVARHMQYMNVQDMRTAKLKRFMARPTFREELELHRVDCLSSNGFTENYDFLLRKEQEFAAAPLIPPRLMNGRELMRLGYAAGPQLGVILEEMQTLQLEGKLNSAEEARAWLPTQFPLG
jgi:poly(A) polymerase